VATFLHALYIKKATACKDYGSWHSNCKKTLFSLKSVKQGDRIELNGLKETVTFIVSGIERHLIYSRHVFTPIGACTRESKDCLTGEYTGTLRVYDIDIIEVHYQLPKTVLLESKGDHQVLSYGSNNIICS